MFKEVHPDRGSLQLDHKQITTGQNYDLGDYPESGFIKCRKCGQTMNRYRHPKGWTVGLTQASTQLNGAVTAGAVTLTVDSNASFVTNVTGSITAFAAHGFGTTVTDAAHGLKGGKVIITSTTNYNGTFYIQNVFTNSFVITAPYVADDATGTWTVPQYLEIYDADTYSDADDVTSFTKVANRGRVDRVEYTAKSSTTGFTGCQSETRTSGVEVHEDNMYVRQDRRVTSGCPKCGTFIYD